MHLTLVAQGDSDVPHEQWLSAHGGHVTCIELDRGNDRRQVMVTSQHDARLTQALETARERASSLRALGFRVRRIKLEVALTHPLAASGLYIEHHVKVLLPTPAMPRLAAVGVRCGAHMSRNAFRTSEGAEERFLTQRFAAGATERADASLRELVAALQTEGFGVAKIEREAVIHDDNLALDGTWGREQPA